MPVKRPLSCFIIACNEGDRIERCLRSVHGWVDELIVLDSGSTDDTVAIARRYADKVYQTDWPGFGAQRNRALSLCSHSWVMNIDADEEVTPQLKDEIIAVLSEENLDVNFIKFPWHTVLFGTILKHGRYSSPQGKLFYAPGAKFKDTSVHETLILPNCKARTLRSPLLHYSWRDYEHAVAKHLHYASLSAKDKFKRGKRASLAFASLRFFTDFLQQYILRGGILDGKAGFVMAVILAQYGFHKYAALWSLQRMAQKDTDNDR
ncbi:glycosyltransferase family 2 protein [Alteromonas sp. C1M14]|uniref:glycosyltransferase family 2 protein n=1 Tax=Alteromonas sp. C1M14 TaxID=2841567 RepID=UPI001C09AF41|nr:glycosyltransferase family 2 protein [Alteromonas sp. C1M14]MBU2978144.1 glycosyltransferase family 2 protein [Alteromonas sp. C1M14]